jgi:hypothetical protein
MWRALETCAEMQSSKAIKPRRTLKKEIIRWAETDTWEGNAKSMFAAEFGRPETLLDTILSNYYGEFMSLQNQIKIFLKEQQQGKPKPSLTLKEWRERKASIKYWEEQIVHRFLLAVQNFDEGEVIKFAESVAFFRERFRLHGLDYEPADRVRFLLLLKKYELEKRRQKWTVRQVANYLESQGIHQFPPERFSVLHRMCKELKFPLAPSRKDKSKKRD